MRISFLILTLAVCAAALAATRSETTTYVDGNLTGISPNTGGTLAFSDDKAMYFHTGLETVAVPYPGIANVELGAVKQTPHDKPPIYKVWQIHKRFAHADSTQTQLMIVNFKNDEGEDKTMTLELAQEAIPGIVEDLEGRTGKKFITPSSRTSTAAAKQTAPAKQGDGWWGDDYWKTTRNADKWSKPAGSPEQQR